MTAARDHHDLRRPAAVGVIVVVILAAVAAILLLNRAHSTHPGVVATGHVEKLGKVKTEVCVHPGIVRLGPCGWAFQPDPLDTVEVGADGTFELHASADALPDALLGVDLGAAEAIDRRADFPDGDAIRAAKAEINAAKDRALELGAVYGPGTYRVATVIASRIEEVGFFSKVYCARKIIVVRDAAGGGWEDLKGRPVFGLAWNGSAGLSLTPSSECWENSPP